MGEALRHHADQLVAESTLDIAAVVNSDVVTLTNTHASSKGTKTIVMTALYTVKNGKITEGKFFYSCGM